MLLLVAIVFGFGAMVGSFLNVCILRLPKNESVVFPGSHCFSCGKAIAWYDNIPIFSYFLLGGRCRQCKKPFSIQYAGIEFLTAVLTAFFFWHFGLTPRGVIYWVLTLALLVQTFIDFKHQIIPDEITLPGIALGLVCSAFFPLIHNQISWSGGLIQGVIGMLVGGGILYVAGTVTEWIVKKEAMGGGDVKLLAMIGTVIGWQGVLWTIFVSSLLGSVVGIYARLRRGDQVIPYGPYLGMAAFLYLFFGQKVIQWYLINILGR